MELLTKGMFDTTLSVILLLCYRNYAIDDRYSSSRLNYNSHPSTPKRLSSVRDSLVLRIHPSSVLNAVGTPPSFVIFNETVETSHLYMRDISVVSPDWLIEMAPHYYQRRRDIFVQPETKRSKEK